VGVAKGSPIGAFLFLFAGIRGYPEHSKRIILHATPLV
jgi:hypothetical protein